MGDTFGGIFNFLSSFQWDSKWELLVFLVIITILLIISKNFKTIATYLGKKFTTYNNETLCYRMFWGLIRDALHLNVKDEIRKSFKQNGFDELSGAEFSTYVKEKSKLLIGMIKMHIRNLYPSNSTNDIPVSMDEIIKYIDDRFHDYEDMFFEIYGEAKKFKKIEVETLKNLEKQFEDEITTFAVENAGKGNCSSCLVIMFTKKQIYDRKADAIRTLEHQMNFCESKLSDIQSDLLQFFGTKLNRKK